MSVNKKKDKQQLIEPGSAPLYGRKRLEEPMSATSIFESKHNSK